MNGMEGGTNIMIYFVFVWIKKIYTNYEDYESFTHKIIEISFHSLQPSGSFDLLGHNHYFVFFSYCQKKNVDQIKGGAVDVSKVASPVASPVALKVQQQSKTKTGQLVALTETETESIGLGFLDKNAHPEPIAEKDSCEDIPSHDVPESGVPLNKGLLFIKFSYETLHFLQEIYGLRSYIYLLK